MWGSLSANTASWALVVSLAAIAACSSVDFDHPRTPTSALAPDYEGGLGRQVAELVAAHPGESGFHPLYDGIEALATRLLLAERAERSIDAQTYLLYDDITARLYLSALLAAADRGVRVRLLIDDFGTKGYDRGMAALTSHPNFELRVFNPFSRRSARMLDFATESGRINRRMHNKSFTVDGVATIVGGRNIGAEYFAAGEEANFGDFDLLALGPVAQQVGSAFDTYWNSEMVVPAQALQSLDDPEAELEERRKRLAAELEGVGATPYGVVLETRTRQTAELQADRLVWAPFRVIYARPERGVDTMFTPLIDAIESARVELLLISPYFVPLESGVERIRRLRERGVRVVIGTNSLASTDVLPVHAGYAPYRKQLVEMGVELRELRPDMAPSGTREVGAGGARSKLHAKVFVVDRRELFVGSFNWDPRSVGINTEMGLLLDSPALADEVASRVIASLPDTTYKVVLNDAGKVRWEAVENGETVTLDSEPHAGLWQRFKVGFLKLMPIEDQL